MKCKNSMLAALCTVLLLCGCASNDYSRYKYAQEAGAEVQKILEAHGICRMGAGRHASDCEYWFVKNEFRGFTFSVYGVKDKGISQEITIAVESEFNQNPEIKRMTLEFYPEPHDAYVTQLSRNGCVIKSGIKQTPSFKKKYQR